MLSLRRTLRGGIAKEHYLPGQFTPEKRKSRLAAVFSEDRWSFPCPQAILNWNYMPSPAGIIHPHLQTAFFLEMTVLSPHLREAG
jgi:hypothetical protein